MSPLTELIGSAKGYGWGSFVLKPADPSFESIASITASGGESSLSFNSIPSTYQHLQIRYNAQVNINFANNNNMGLQFNSDTASNYARHRIGAANGTISIGYFSSGGQISNDIVPSTVSTNYFGSGIIEIFDYKRTDKFKTITSILAYDISSDGMVYLLSGIWRSTSAITSISFQPQFTWGANSTFHLYGIKG